MPSRLRAWLRARLYAGGTRQDRLRDPERVVGALGLRAGDRVADLGPGGGELTLPLAAAVAPDGVVYAADAAAERLEALRRSGEALGVANVVPVLVPPDRLELPEPVDVLFVSATYHHLADRPAYFAAAHSLLHRGGRVIIFESRGEGLLAPWLGRHATAPRLIVSEMERAGFALTGAPRLDVASGHWLGTFEVAA